MVPADSARISRVPAYSGAALSLSCLRLRDFHPLRYGFPTASADNPASLLTVLQPRHCRNSAGLGCCAFARHYLRNHFCFLFLRVLRCFSSPGSPGTWYHACRGQAGCPIRKSVLKRVFAPGHGLSQLVTSFVASESQGILHVPFSPFCMSLKKSCLVTLRLSVFSLACFASASNLHRIDPALVCMS